jgi:hypothetical protein
MHRVPGLLLLAAVVTATALSCQESTTITGNHPAQTPTFTAAWQGLWQIDSVVRDCNGDSLDTAVDLMNICPGDTVRLDVGLGFTVGCTGSVTDTSFTVTCDDLIEGSGCRKDVKASWTLHRSADTAVGTADVDATIVGLGCDFTGRFCLRFEQTATRIGDGTCPTGPR